MLFIFIAFPSTIEEKRFLKTRVFRPSAVRKKFANPALDDGGALFGSCVDMSKPDMAAGTSQPTPMYADCGACGAREADLKCPCKTSHYCNAACQRADFRTHKKKCTHWLLKNIGRERNELQVMTAQSSSSVREVAAKEHRLAAQHKTVGDLFLPENFPAAEQHLKQALEIFRKLSALEKQGGLGADYGSCLDNSISTLLSLGSLYYSSWNWNKLGDAVQAYKEARDSLRKNMRAHGSTPNRQQTLALILRAHGEVYNKQYEHELDKSQCFAENESGRHFWEQAS